MLQPVSSRDNASLEEPSHPVSMPQVHTTPSKPHLRSACKYFVTGNEPIKTRPVDRDNDATTEPVLQTSPSKDPLGATDKSCLVLIAA